MAQVLQDGAVAKTGSVPFGVGWVSDPMVSCGRGGTRFEVKYPAPCDYIPRRSYPLFRAREVLDYLATPGAAELLAIPTPH